MQEKIKSLIYSLPEDIELAKHAGDFKREKRLLDQYFNDPMTPEFLKDRLLVEKEILRRQYLEYPYNEDEALKLIQEEIPDFTYEELQKAEDSGAADWMYINGKVHLQRRFFSSMKKVYADIAERTGNPMEDNVMLNTFIEDIKKTGSSIYHIHMKASIKIKDEYFHPGKVLVHLPIPTECASMQNIQIHSFSEGGKMDIANSLSRTISFEENIKENHAFFVEYSYDCVQNYVDPFSKKAEDCDEKEYLEELYPHIVFSPTLKALCEELSKGKETPMEKAWAFYRYCTENVTYSYMRSYFTNEHIAEYAATHRIGDCGVKAILFITLCRCAGIPAHWQSGLYVTKEGAGNHDWAMFYVKPFGWMYADPSFGGSAYRFGNYERQKYYFGNLDCFRMVANNEYQQEFAVKKTCWRSDPYDNQSGEVEYVNEQGLLHSELVTNQEVLEFEKTK